MSKNTSSQQTVPDVVRRVFALPYDERWFTFDRVVKRLSFNRGLLLHHEAVFFFGGETVVLEKLMHAMVKLFNEHCPGCEWYRHGEAVYTNRTTMEAWCKRVWKRYEQAMAEENQPTEPDIALKVKACTDSKTYVPGYTETRVDFRPKSKRVEVQPDWLLEHAQDAYESINRKLQADIKKNASRLVEEHKDASYNVYCSRLNKANGITVWKHPEAIASICEDENGYWYTGEVVISAHKREYVTERCASWGKYNFPDVELKIYATKTLR